MSKLYYENQYEKNFTAEVVNIFEKNAEFHIELDKTYFYPQGENLPCDTGYIESIEVIRVYEKDDVIYHVTQKKPVKIHKVKCSINWEKRFDVMQHHLGQHILSSYFLKLFNGNTLKFKLDDNHCSIDIDKILTIDEIDKIEKLSNDTVFENIPVEVLYPTKSELKKLSLKKNPSKIGSATRVVKIGDASIKTCNGLHPKSTIEIQLIKISKYENLKTFTRIEFLCGKRAVNYSFSNDKFSSKICKALKCDEKDALNQIESFTEKLNKISSENASLKSQIADYEIEHMIKSSEKIDNINVVRQVYSNKDLKYATLIASKLTDTENVIALMAIKGDSSSNLIFMCSKNLKFISMNTLLKDAITLIDGKGGGSDFSAKGGGKSTNNLDSALDYAFMKIKNLIMQKSIQS